MKMFKVILFIILTIAIPTTLFIGFGLSVMGGMATSDHKINFGLILFALNIVSLSFYWKLLRNIQNKILLSKKKETFYWFFTFMFSVIIPGGFMTQNYLNQRNYKVEQSKYYADHCTKVITKKNHYSVLVCENGTVVADTSDAAFEYREENK